MPRKSGKEDINTGALERRDGVLREMKPSFLNGGYYLSVLRRDDGVQQCLNTKTYPEFVLYKKGLLRVVFPVTGGEVNMFLFVDAEPLCYTEVTEDNGKKVKYEAPHTTIPTSEAVIFLKKLVTLCTQQGRHGLAIKYSRILKQIQAN